MGEGTGACGLNCMVFGLFRQGKCSPCGSGLEPQAQRKLAAQLKLLGGTCAIIAMCGGTQNSLLFGRLRPLSLPEIHAGAVSP